MIFYCYPAGCAFHVCTCASIYFHGSASNDSCLNAHSNHLYSEPASDSRGGDTHEPAPQLHPPVLGHGHLVLDPDVPLDQREVGQHLLAAEVALVVPDLRGVFNRDLKRVASR